MSVNFWYPMIRNEDLGPEKPAHGKVPGVNFAIFRASKGKETTCTLLANRAERKAAKSAA